MSHSHFQIGFGKADITAFRQGSGLLGWGYEKNIACEVKETLHARAMVLKDRDGKCSAYVCLDLCFVSASVRYSLIEQLKAVPELPIPSERLVITATHTHSGPSGYTHSLFYELTCPGFAPEVLQKIVNGALESLRIAYARMQPGLLRFGKVTVRSDPPIAFNRAIEAYCANPEISGKPRAHQAINPTMWILCGEDLQNRPLGVLSTFALHCTSIQRDGTSIHSDHKGIAASLLESQAPTQLKASPDFVAIFAQGAAGDVTPNHRWHAQRQRTVGRFDDDEDSARWVASVQAENTLKALKQRASWPILEARTDGTQWHVTMEQRSIRPAFVQGRSGVKTSRGCLGIAMAAGTREGPGPLGPLTRLIQTLQHTARRVHSNDPKIPMLWVGPGEPRRLFGVLQPTDIIRWTTAAPALQHLRQISERGVDIDGEEWIPTTLPLQLLRIGQLTLVALPNEPTTIAGLRIRQTLRPILSAAGTNHIVIQGYANTYAGYLTTEEEYLRQGYEGAYTLFGPHTLAAHCDVLSQMATALIEGTAHTHLQPPLKPPDDVTLRARASVLPSAF